MSWEQEQARLAALLEEVISDNEDNVAVESDASLDEDLIQESDHDSLSEQDVLSVEESEVEECQSENRQRDYIGKDKVTKWHKVKGRTAIRTRAHNIITEASGPKGMAKTCKSPLECFQLFITDDMIAEITSCTNIYIEKLSHKYARQRDCNKTDEIEIKALIGLLILSGLCKSSHRKLKDLWDESRLGIAIFHKTMSYNRFSFLLRCLRFDDVNSREARKSTDRFAPIRNIYMQFNNHCGDNYNLNENFTIDEQLLKFRGRCIFRQYIPSKPGRYGLKSFALCDAKTFYTYQSEPYLGQQPDGPYKVSYKPGDIVMRLCASILGSGRNLTCDNWYTSIPLAEELLKNKITMVGTLRKNKKEIPAAFVGQRDVGTSIFGFHYKLPLTLVSYCPKQKKNVLLISTLHDNNDNIITTATNEQKPEIVLFYNETKGGVDTADQMCGNYSISRICSRWPLRFFFHMLDTSGINANVIYNWNMVQSQSNMKRPEFLESLGLSMLQSHLDKRSSQPGLPKALKRMLNAPGTSTEGLSPTKKQRCIVCPRSKDIKTMSHCNFCKQTMCQKHMKLICSSCYEK